jgi:hypothetical protein
VNQDKPTLEETLNKNKTLVLAILGTPLLGMAIAFVIILYKAPDNMFLVLAVIFFLSVQYIIMMFFLMKRLETLNNDLNNSETRAKKPRGQ